MGKKHGTGGGGGSLFSAYLSSLPEPANAVADEDTYLPDSMKASTLLERIGSERSWSARDIEKDVDTLERNRLYTIKELRVLSPQSWKEIELLPLVKDLLRQAVNPPDDYIKLKQEKKKLKKEKRDRKKEKLEKMNLKDKDDQKGQDGQTGQDGQDVKDASKSEGTAVDEEGQVKIHQSRKENKAKGESISSLPSSESSDSSDSDSSVSNTEAVVNATNLLSVKTPAKPSLVPGRIQAMGNRIRVTAGNGTTYEADRYCPHKHVDLATKGVVVGNTLFCNKHNWAFALDNKGYCSKHGATVNACRVDW